MSNDLQEGVNGMCMIESPSEAQIQVADSPPKQAEKPSQAVSNESKPRRGGKRPGAGRKPNYAKRLLSGVKPLTAAETLEGIDVKAVVHDLLKHGSRPVKLQTLTVLWDRIYGKPKQDVAVSGGLAHVHTRDPLLSALPKEALETLARAYDDVLARYALPSLPTSETAQDGQHNQIESNPAIEQETGSGG